MHDHVSVGLVEMHFKMNLQKLWILARYFVDMDSHPVYRSGISVS